MQKNYRLVSFMLLLGASVFSFAQETPQFKEVLLDGKPAKLNVKTGEITLLEDLVKTDAKKTDTTTFVKKIAISPSEERNNKGFHTVKENETLLDIANKYNTTLTELKRLNNLETTLIETGEIIRLQEIVMDANDVSNADTSITEKSNTPKAIEVEPVTGSRVNYEKSKTDYHTVKKGQTLYSIAKLYNISLDDLKRNNGLTSNLIISGQQLQIAIFKTNALVVTTPYYIVKKGDTLFSIAKRNNLTVSKLKSLNGLTSNLITIGQQLQLK